MKFVAYKKALLMKVLLIKALLIKVSYKSLLLYYKEKVYKSVADKIISESVAYSTVRPQATQVSCNNPLLTKNDV